MNTAWKCTSTVDVQEVSTSGLRTPATVEVCTMYGLETPAWMSTVNGQEVCMTYGLEVIRTPALRSTVDGQEVCIMPGLEVIS